MANKQDKTDVTAFECISNPNNSTNGVTISPTKVGDLCVDTVHKVLYFSFGLGATDWGTCGTVGA